MHLPAADAGVEAGVVVDGAGLARVLAAPARMAPSRAPRPATAMKMRWSRRRLWPPAVNASLRASAPPATGVTDDPPVVVAAVVVAAAVGVVAVVAAGDVPAAATDRATANRDVRAPVSRSSASPTRTRLPSPGRRRSCRTHRSRIRQTTWTSPGRRSVTC